MKDLKDNGIYLILNEIKADSRILDIGCTNHSANLVSSPKYGYLCDEKFNIIIARELIEHLSNIGLFLKSSLNHLKADGKLIITTPNVFNILNMLSLIINKNVTVNKEYIRCYDKITLTLIERKGFKINKFYFTPSPSDAKGGAISRFLYKFGFRQLGGTGIFIVCSIGDK